MLGRLYYIVVPAAREEFEHRFTAQIAGCSMLAPLASVRGRAGYTRKCAPALRSVRG